MAGTAFANPIWQGGWGNWNTAIKNQVVAQNAIIINPATAVSGPAVGTGITVSPVINNAISVAVLGGSATSTNNSTVESGAIGSATSEATAIDVPDNDVVQAGVQ
jgi:hypothetical protein